MFASVDTIIDKDFPRGWTQCPVPGLLGVPVVAKAHVKEYPAGRQLYNQIGVYMLVDPYTGLAPPEWSSRADLGMLGFARTDGIPFTKDEFFKLYDYIFTLMDYYSEGDAQSIVTKCLNPTAYRDFTLSRAS